MLRIKINGQSLIKLSRQHNGRDFILTYPPTFQGNNQFESHFSLHTPNDRVTFKTTSIKVDGTEMLPLILSLLKQHPKYYKKVTKRDLNLYGGENFLDVSDPNETSYAGSIALNLKDSALSNYFMGAKTPDSKFKMVKDIRIPKGKYDRVTIKFGVGKNFKGESSTLVKKYPEHIIVTEPNYAGDEYTFVFFINYSFPNIENRS